MTLEEVLRLFNGEQVAGVSPVQPQPTAPVGDPFYEAVQAFSGTPQAYQPNIWPGGEQYQRTASTDKIVEGQPITRNYLLGQLLAPGWSYMDGEGNEVGPGVQDVKNDEAARNMLVLMDKYGVNKLTDLPPELVQQLPSKGLFEERSGGFWSSLGDFLTNPGVMMVLGAGAGAIAGAGGAAAGGASGAAGAGAYAPAVWEGYGGLGAAGAGGASASGIGTALGSGITTGATGAGGITAGSAGAGGITAGGTGAGTAALTGAGALAPGAFAAESLYPVAGGQTAAAAGGLGGTGAGTTAASGTALQRILDGVGTTQDYLSLAGQVIPSVLGMYASNRQTDALQGLADRYFNMGAPYRDELARISEDPNAFYSGPQATNATESVLQRLSKTTGNPAGSPYAQALTVDALFNEYGAERDRLAGFGGLTAYNSAAPGAAGSAVNSRADFYNALGGGIADVTTPRYQPRTLAEIFRAGGY